MKTRAVWMAIGIVFGGSALSYAGVAATSSHAPSHKPSVKESVEPNESESPEAAETESDANGQHPINHGFYVSQAAQCRSVNDTTNNISFTAPAGCSTDGKTKGAYVSQVARSDIGKGPHGKGHAHTK
jgi:hypothetical protein